ncbi:MAG: tRNA (guanosine(46)-N7)-methyltransferase TrmB [Bacteroidetes bacterium]|nr:tRNA (guanosine(46)-N7)-methyltransferase TrmB [Bacteroidota bacterium]
MKQLFIMSIDFSKYPLPKRFRHHTAAHLYVPLSQMKNKPDYYPPVFDTLDWKQVFVNGRKPDLIDIGCGKGAFLLESALQYPDKNILGIELRKQPVDWIAGVIQGENLQNCAVLWYNITNGLGFVDSNSIEKIFYLFPDPWPKRKHYKRRAFNSDSIVEFARVLKKGGEFYLATDLKESLVRMRCFLDKSSLFSYKIIENDEEWNLPVTNKEKFCRANNIEFFRIKCFVI